jgi:hypothetical protein
MKKPILLLSILFLSSTTLYADITGVPRNLYSSPYFYSFSIPVTDPVANSHGIDETWYCLNIQPNTNTSQSNTRLHMIETVTAAMAANISVTVYTPETGGWLPGNCDTPDRIGTNR